MLIGCIGLCCLALYGVVLRCVALCCVGVGVCVSCVVDVLCCVSLCCVASCGMSCFVVMLCCVVLWFMCLVLRCVALPCFGDVLR